MSIENQIVWITGATSGIGKAIAEAFAQHGATVVISGRNSEALFGLAKFLDGSGYRAIPIPCDVRDEAQVLEAAGKIHRTIGKVDVLVNNAGTTIFKSFLESSIDEFDQIVNTNLRGAFLCTKATLPGMIERKEGLIVMINSVTSKYEFTNSSIYAASKLGLRGMTDVLRKEVRQHGVRIVSVYPGATETNIWSESILKKYSHRMMKPSVVAQAILDLSKLPKDVMMEEILLRPIGGDL